MGSVKRQLFEKLREFHNDKDFVVGVMSIVDTEENYQRIIDFIDAGKNVTVENIIALAVLPDDAAEKKALNEKRFCE